MRTQFKKRKGILKSIRTASGKDFSSFQGNTGAAVIIKFYPFKTLITANRIVTDLVDYYFCLQRKTKKQTKSKKDKTP